MIFVKLFAIFKLVDMRLYAGRFKCRAPLPWHPPIFGFQTPLTGAYSLKSLVCDDLYIEGLGSEVKRYVQLFLRGLESGGP